MVRFELNSFSLGWGPMAGSCEDGNEPSNSLNGRGFLD